MAAPSSSPTMPPPPPQRILVTGGAGFLGSNLIRRLLSKPPSEVSHIWCFDDLSTGSRQMLARIVGADQLAAEEASGRFTLVVGDVAYVRTAGRLLADAGATGLTHIFHLACPASPPQYQREPFHTVRTCTEGTALVLALARRDAARVLLASTSEVYGEPREHPQTEAYAGNVSCTGLRSCYDEGKRCMEAMAMAHHRQFGTLIKLVRIFNTYGPGLAADDGRVVSNFIVQALARQPLTVYGHGQQTRSFCFVADLIDGFLSMMASPPETLGPINLGNPNTEVTMLDLAQTIQRLTDSSEADLVYKPMPADDPSVRRPCIEQARTQLGWRPTTTLEDGLRQTVAYFAALPQTAAASMPPPGRRMVTRSADLSASSDFYKQQQSNRS